MAKGEQTIIRKIPQVKMMPVLALPKHGVYEVAALKAAVNGEASPEQQMRLMKWIIMNVGGIGALSFQPDNPNATAFKEGQRSVAIYLQHFIDEPMESVKRRFNLTDNHEEKING